MTTANNQDLSNKIALVLQHLSEGGTLKDLAQFTADELDAVNAVAASYFTAHKYNDAVELYRFLCLYDHLEPKWHYSLGVSLQAAGDYKEAASSYATATFLNFGDPRPQAQAGYCLMALGKLKDAEMALRGCLEVCGDNPEHEDIKKQASELLESVLQQLSGKKEG